MARKTKRQKSASRATETDACRVWIDIDGEPPVYAATTPHLPGIEGRGPEMHLAFNRLAEKIREHRAKHEPGPVPWDDAEGVEAPSGAIEKSIKGLCPAEKTELKRNTKAAE